MVCMDLRENFTMLAVGSRKSGKTNLLKNVASLFKLKQAQVYIIGGGELVDWGKKHGMHAYEYGDPAWETEFMRIFKQEVSGRSELLKQARSAGGIEARNRLFETFEPEPEADDLFMSNPASAFERRSDDYDTFDNF